MNTLVRDKKILKIKKAQYKSGYVISFAFSNGTTQEIDFQPFLSKPAQHRDVRKYLDVQLFKKFSITRHGDIVWNDYEMCFPFESIYKGKI